MVRVNGMLTTLPCNEDALQKEIWKKKNLHDKHTLSISLFLYLKKEVTPQTSKSLFPPWKTFWRVLPRFTPCTFQRRRPLFFQSHKRPNTQVAGPKPDPDRHQRMLETERILWSLFSLVNPGIILWRLQMSNSHFATFLCDYSKEPKKSAEVFYERFLPI